MSKLIAPMRPTLIATPEVESILPSEVAVGFEILEQESFVRMLYLERKRTARTGRRFVLMLLESGSVLKASGDKDTLARVLRSVASATRDTDIKGWYKDGEIFGIIFTEIDTDGRLVGRALLSRFYTAITSTLSIEEINEISLSFHVFPEESSKGTLGTPNDPALYPELSPDEDQMKGARRLKRAMDIVGSLFALAVSTPVMIAIAAAIKLTSKGPVFFCQPRVGECGRCFTFLKFRTMLTGCDDSVHKEYVKSLIGWPAQSIQDDQRSADYADRALSAQEQPGRTAAILQRSGGGHVAGGSAPRYSIRSEKLRHLASPAVAFGEAGDHRNLAGGRPRPDPILRDGAHGSQIRTHVVLLAGSEDTVGDPAGCYIGQWRLLTSTRSNQWKLTYLSLPTSNSATM